MKKTNNAGSTLVLAMLTLAVLAIVSASMLTNLSMRYHASLQSSCWSEALQAAESGAELAMIQINGTNSFASPWVKTGTSGGGTTYQLSQKLPFTTATDQTYVTVTADNKLSDSGGNKWWRITSKGTVQLPGSNYTAGFESALLDMTGAKNHRSLLRKLSVRTDSTSGSLTLPQMSRTIQILAKPLQASLFGRPMTVQKTISFSGGAYTDSFNSSKTTMSTNGQYDVTKRGSHGDVASNSSGNLSDLRGSLIMGNAMSNSGTIQNTTGVTGSVLNNFSTTLPPVSDPIWTSGVAASPTVINGTASLNAGGTQANPVRYVLSSLTVSAGKVLTLVNPTPGTDVYIQILVQGKTTTSGSGYILQQKGVHATFYCDGDVTVSGSAFDNENGYASYLQIYGVTPSTNTTPKYTVSGGATFIGIVYAPAWALTVSGGGDYMGSATFLSATVSGAAGFHYDESLGGSSGATGSGYMFANWVEDIE